MAVAPHQGTLAAKISMAATAWDTGLTESIDRRD